MRPNHNGGEREARLGVLDDLIKYMRRLELEKDAPKDALGEGLGAIAEDIDREEDESPEERMREGEPLEEEAEPEAVLEIEAGPKEELAEHEEGETPLDHMEEELSPFQQKMKDYFNNRDKPKIGKSMSFIMATKNPDKKSTSVMDDLKRKGKPFRR